MLFQILCMKWDYIIIFISQYFLFTYSKFALNPTAPYIGSFDYVCLYMFAFFFGKKFSLLNEIALLIVYTLHEAINQTKLSTSIYPPPPPTPSFLLPTSRCILFDGENISFDASLVIYINSTNIPPIMIINRIYETQNLLSL